MRELAALVDDILFCERDPPCYENTRDLRALGGARLCLYASLDQLAQAAGEHIAEADLVIVGST